MKFTGITRPLDSAGRFVIPKEIRETYNLNEGNLLEIYTMEDGLFIKKHCEAKCKSCGIENNLVDFAGLKFCKACLKKAGELC